MAIAIVTLIILIFINGFFAASELAFVNLNDNKVKRAADQGDKKAKKMYHLISQPSRFLSTIQIGITLAGFLSSAFAADFFADPMAQALYNIGVPLNLNVLNTISVVFITILLSYFTLVFGELVPKQLALQNGEAIANIAIGPVSFLAKVTSPIVKFLTLSINLIFKLFRTDPNAQNEEATEEDIRLLVDLGRERGTINPAEELMIHNIFDFNDTSAMNILTHRTEMVVLSVDAKFPEVLEKINEHRFTRFPVYEGDIDNIVGIFHAKDMFQYIHGGQPNDFDLRKIIRKPLFVQETQTIDVLFSKMRQGQTHIAIVLDEYGGTQGLITIEDVIEEIVGDISSESLEVGSLKQEITKVSDHEYLILSSYRLRELEDLTGVALPTDEFDTVNGFLINEIGHIPSAGEHPIISYGKLTFEVKSVHDNRINSVLLKIKSSEE